MPQRSHWKVANAFRGDRADTLRTVYYVAVAALAALVPLILFVGFWLRAEIERNQQELESVLTTRAVTLAQRVDSEVRQQFAVLGAIASLPTLDPAGVDEFRDAAARIVAVMPAWSAIGLADPATGELLRDALAPAPGNGALKPDPAVVKQVASERWPTVRTIAAPGDGAGDRVLLYVPVIRDTTIPWVVIAAMRASAIQALIQEQSGGDHLLAMIVDENRNVLARSRATQDVEGEDVGTQLDNWSPSRRSGLYVADTPEGQEVYTAFQRSAQTNWLVLVATSRNQLQALSARSTWALVAAGLLSLTVAVVLAIVLFYNVIQRRVSDERLAASRALGELDARLLATTQTALAEQHKAASEREVLLREIYHRVKNNLQIVQSLLRLGSRDLDPAQREPFESAVRRIGAMARVHNLLYNSPDLASIDLKDYLDELVSEIAGAYGAEQRHVRTEIAVESMRIPLDTAVPLAFVAVELLTNAFKHAFPDDRGGTVRIEASRIDGQGVLVVEDDGVGVQMPAPVRRRPLGLTIVERLVTQIGGVLERPTSERSRFRVTFPLDAPPSALPLPGRS